MGNFLVDLHGDFLNFRKRHGFVRFVVEIERSPSVRMIADAAIERDNRAVFGSANVTDERILIDGVAHQRQQIGLGDLFMEGLVSRR